MSGLIDCCENDLESGGARDFSQACEVILESITCACAIGGNGDQLLVRRLKYIERMSVGWRMADPHVNDPFMQEPSQGDGIPGHCAGKRNRNATGDSF